MDHDRDELHAVFKQIIALAHVDKIVEVEKIVRGWKIHKDEFTRLFGQEKSKANYAHFLKHWEIVEIRTAEDIVKRIRHKQFEGVEVVCLNSAPPNQLSPDEKSALLALTDKSVKLYSVHFRARHAGKNHGAHAAHKGYALPCFVKIGGHWRCGLKLGKFLRPAKAPRIRK